MFSIIVAVDKNNGIGYKGELLYRIPEDLKRFKKLTIGNTVVMGRKTYESIGYPLPDRTNIILTKDKNYKVDNDLVIVINKIEDIIEKYTNSKEEVFIIGGSEIYELFLPYVDKIYTTVIFDKKVADRFFPKFNIDEWDFDNCIEKNKYNDYTYAFVNFTRKKGVNKMNMDKLKRHEELCNEIHDTYIAKNNDYGDSVHDLMEKLGPITLVTRLGDKYNRICSLLQKGLENQKVKSESILDTFLDLANYAIIGYIEMEQYLKNKEEKINNDDNCEEEKNIDQFRGLFNAWIKDPDILNRISKQPFISYPSDNSCTINDMDAYKIISTSYTSSPEGTSVVSENEKSNISSSKDTDFLYGHHAYTDKDNSLVKDIKVGGSKFTSISDDSCIKVPSGYYADNVDIGLIVTGQMENYPEQIKNSITSEDNKSNTTTTTKLEI